MVAHCYGKHLVPLRFRIVLDDFRPEYATRTVQLNKNKSIDAADNVHFGEIARFLNEDMEFHGESTTERIVE
jgi:hypothetical protein